MGDVSDEIAEWVAERRACRDVRLAVATAVFWLAFVAALCAVIYFAWFPA